MLLTYGEVQDSSISNITSASPSDPQFGLYIQEAVSRIAARGDWPGMVIPMRTCLRNGCIVWPRHVQHVRKVADCRGQFQMHGLFYDFLDWRNRNWYRDGYWDGLDRGWRARRNIVQQGWSPVFAPIRGPGRYVRLYHQAAEDLGATATLFGIDNAGNKLRTRNSDGMTWSEGVTLTAAYPYAQSPGYISDIHRVVKSKTQCNLTLFGAYQSSVSLTTYIGYVWNVDNGTWVSVTVVNSDLGYPTLQFGMAIPPAVVSQQIGLIYNYDLGTCQNVVAHGTPGNYYLEFGGTASVSTNCGQLVFNVDIQQWQTIVLRGTIQGSQYLDISDPSAVAPNSLAGPIVLEPIADYEPSETNPRYAKMNFHTGGFYGKPGEVLLPGQERLHNVLALVKLRQLPLVNPNDLVVLPPEALPALKEMVQAVVAGEATDMGSKGGFTLSAIEMMNRILEDWMPDEQIPVSLGAMGRGGHVGRQRCF